jgi:hypothetical protein
MLASPHGIHHEENDQVPLDKPVRRIAIVGTAVIGASWTALYLAQDVGTVTGFTPGIKRMIVDHWVETRHFTIPSRRTPRRNTRTFCFDDPEVAPFALYQSERC